MLIWLRSSNLSTTCISSNQAESPRRHLYTQLGNKSLSVPYSRFMGVTRMACCERVITSVSVEDHMNHYAPLSSEELKMVLRASYVYCIFNTIWLYILSDLLAQWIFAVSLRAVVLSHSPNITGPASKLCLYWCLSKSFRPVRASQTVD